MVALKYILLALSSWIMTILAVLGAPLIALAVDADGNLPKYLKWFQTPDAPCFGAPFWAEKNPSYSRYMLCVTWLQRNPAQGFDQFVKANIAYNTSVTVHGDLNINDQSPVKGGWFFLTSDNAFQFAAIVPIGQSYTLDFGAGWRLDPIAKGYKTPTLGGLIATPIRLHKI
jgi:hypothetical protein